MDAAIIDAIALRVVEELVGRGLVGTTSLVDADTLARRLGVTRSFVYEHAEELGVRRLGTGSRARLRFDVAKAERAISCVAGRESRRQEAPAKPTVRRRRRSATLGTTARLLPIRRREEAA